MCACVNECTGNVIGRLFLKTKCSEMKTYELSLNLKWDLRGASILRRKRMPDGQKSITILRIWPEKPIL